MFHNVIVYMIPILLISKPESISGFFLLTNFLPLLFTRVRDSLFFRFSCACVPLICGLSYFCTRVKIGHFLERSGKKLAIFRRGSVVVCMIPTFWLAYMIPMWNLTLASVRKAALTMRLLYPLSKYSASDTSIPLPDPLSRNIDIIHFFLLKIDFYLSHNARYLEFYIVLLYK